MKVTITGGLGFIGSFMAEAFRDEGHSVVVIDDRTTNVVDDIDGVFVSANDLRDEWIGGDLVIHCASPVGAVSLLEMAGEIAPHIVTTTAHVAHECASRRIPLLNISTSEVYGTSGVNAESDPLTIPAAHSARLEYAVGKAAGEQIVQNTPWLRSLTVRPFNVAGPRQTRAKGFAIPTFIEQALSGDPLTVFGDGEQERAFTAVYDVADFALHATREPDMFTGQIVNVGNPGNRTTINALAQRVLDLTGSKSEIVHTTGKAIHGEAYEEAAGYVKVPNISRLYHRFGWTPRIGLDDLLGRAIADTRKRVSV